MAQPNPAPTNATVAQLGPIAQAVFSQEILDAMGLASLSEAERTDLYDTMIATIQDRVLARVLDQLSDKERGDLTRLLNHSNADETSAFIADHIPDLNGLMLREALQYKAEMIQNAKHIDQVLGVHSTDDDLPVPYDAPGLPATYQPDQSTV